MLPNIPFPQASHPDSARSPHSVPPWRCGFGSSRLRSPSASRGVRGVTESSERSDGRCGTASPDPESAGLKRRRDTLPRHSGGRSHHDESGCLRGCTHRNPGSAFRHRERFPVVLPAFPAPRIPRMIPPAPPHFGSVRGRTVPCHPIPGYVQ